MAQNFQLVVIGGGAAGFFAAINYALLQPTHQIVIIEKTNRVLDKVRISGGGRCNVTHACFVPRELVKHYPRGERELLSAFSRFQPADTMAWFAERGVDLKIEADGRMFPTSDNSQTIVDCLYQAALQAGIKVWYKHTVEQILPTESGQWHVKMTQNTRLFADKVFFATGSSQSAWQILQQLGHSIEKPVPSLFTFRLNDPLLNDLAGLSVPFVQIKLANSKLQSMGPLLVTHWGLSGPAVLRLSAWGALVLHERHYQTDIFVNWTGSYDTVDLCYAALADLRQDEDNKRKQTANTPQFGVPLRLWKRLMGEFAALQWAALSNKQLLQIAQFLVLCPLQMTGKGVFKDEFVTCGGISLKEVDFKTMQSKHFPNLYFGGECLNIDAITGGFNFQAAWTTAWVAAQAMATAQDT